MAEYTGIHWVESPEYQSKASNGGEEGRGLTVLSHCLGTTVYRKLVDDDKVSNASHGIVSPLLAALVPESSEKPSQNHNHIGYYGDEDVGTVQSGEECKIKEQERGGEAPVHIASPVYLAVDILLGVGSVFV